MKVEFRTATIDDVEGIIALCNECFAENTSLEYANKVFKETAHDENNIYLVGTVNGQIIAHAKLTMIPTMYEKMNKYCILNHVCVKPEYRRHKIATQMLEVCEKICKEKDCVCMELWSNNFREAAHACYKRYGFIVNDAKFFSREVK